MNVTCEKCGARYDFPAEQIPAEGLRARCASCGHMMTVQAEGASSGEADFDDFAGDAESAAEGLELPAAAPRRPGSFADAQARSSREARGPMSVRLDELPAGDRPNAKRAQQVHSTKKSEKDLDEGPKVIVDIGQFGDGTPEPEPPAATTEEPPAEAGVLPGEPLPDAAVFSPLTAPPPALPAAESPPPKPAPVDLAPAGEIEVREVRPPSVGWVFLVLLVVVVGGFTTYVSWRNDWAPVWEDPRMAIELAFAPDREAPAPVAATPVVVEERQTGALKVQGLDLEVVDLPDPADKRGRAKIKTAVLRGQLINGTNRIQKAIGIEASLTRGKNGEPVRRRVVPCCDTFAPEAVPQVAVDPGHLHFDKSFNRAAQVQLTPGESRPFAVIFRALADDPVPASLEPAARVKFAEAERPQ